MISKDTTMIIQQQRLQRKEQVFSHIAMVGNGLEYSEELHPKAVKSAKHAHIIKAKSYLRRLNP